MRLFQGMLNNLQEVSAEELQKEYSKYLVEGETVEIGFKLVRDVLLFTNLRIIDFDKRGATGKRMSVVSIYLDSIYDVSCETAGFGLDDSEITISFITSPFRKVNNPEVQQKRCEFPKKYDMAPLYQKLQQICMDNIKTLNS